MGIIVAAKLVLARFIARMKTAGLQTNVVFLTSVLIVAVRDVQQTQTVVQDSTVVRKDNGMNLVSAVHIVLENLVIQTTTVADLARFVILISVSMKLAKYRLLLEYLVALLAQDQ